MKKRIITVFLLLSGVAFGQGAKEFTLKEAQDYAIKNAYNAKVDSLNLAIAIKKVKETTAIGLPQVNGEVKFQNFLDIPTTVIPANAFNPTAPEGELVGVQFGTDYSTTASITASQLIFDGSYLVGLRAARTYTDLSRRTLSNTELEIKDMVAQAYYTALVADENVKVLEATLKNMDKLYAETKAIYDNGLVEEQDVEQMQLTVANMQNALTRAERQSGLTKDLLKLQMGMELSATIGLKEDMEAVAGSADVESLVSKEFNAGNHPQYQMAQTGEALSLLDLKNKRSAYYPKVGAFFTHQQQALRNNFDVFENLPWYPSTLWGINITVPIFSSNMRRSQVSQAKLELEKTQVQVKQLDQSLQLEARSAKAEYSSAYEVFNTEKENLALAERIQTKTLKKYKEGLASSMELTQAQNQYLTTQGNYINAAMQLLSAKARLDKVMNNY